MAFKRVPGRLFQGSATDPHCCSSDTWSCAVKGTHRDTKTLSLVTDPMIDRDLYVLEIDEYSV